MYGLKPDHKKGGMINAYKRPPERHIERNTVVSTNLQEKERFMIRKKKRRILAGLLAIAILCGTFILEIGTALAAETTMETEETGGVSETQ